MPIAEDDPPPIVPIAEDDPPPIVQVEDDPPSMEVGQQRYAYSNKYFKRLVSQK